MNKNCFLITGPSASGKTTIAELVMQANDNIKKIITSTTREMRSGEENGVHYNFFSKEEFEEKLKNDEFFEHAEVYGNYYGSLKKSLDDVLSQEKIPLFVVDIQGAQKLSKTVPDIKTIFIMPESISQLEKRLTERGTSEEINNARINKAKEELDLARDFDYCVINKEGQVDNTVKEVLQIIES